MDLIVRLGLDMKEGCCCCGFLEARRRIVAVRVVRTTLVAGDCSSVFVVGVMSFSISVVVERR